MSNPKLLLPLGIRENVGTPFNSVQVDSARTLCIAYFLGGTLRGQVKEGDIHTNSDGEVSSRRGVV
jgi:hypothetical protein